MDFSHIGRNDPCPCGSGKKFKRCHLGREADITANRLNIDPYDAAKLILALPPVDHPRAQEMAGSLDLTSAAGKKISLVFKDLAAYLKLGLLGQDAKPGASGGIFINPQKTRVLAPEQLFLAISPDVDDSTLIHQLAHCRDYLQGSGLMPGRGAALARETGLPLEMLEHPQEFGEALVSLSQQFEVELDADDEIVAILARHQLLLPGKLIAQAKRDDLVAACEKALRYLRDHQDEVNARIKSRAGYMGPPK